MTREAEARIYEKVRRGEIITPEDHLTTIDTVEELEAFRAGLIANNRMTPEAQTAIYRHQIKIGEK